MSVFREISWTFRGQEVTAQASLLLLKRLQAKGINAVNVARGVTMGSADLVDVAVIMPVYLAAAGVSITEDEAYGYIIMADVPLDDAAERKAMTDERAKELQSFFEAFSASVFPAVDFGKKRAAPEKTKPNPSTRKRKPKTST